jgi:hypothetical protein
MNAQQQARYIPIAETWQGCTQHRVRCVVSDAPDLLYCASHRGVGVSSMGASLHRRVANHIKPIPHHEWRGETRYDGSFCSCLLRISFNRCCRASRRRLDSLPKFCYNIFTNAIHCAFNASYATIFANIAPLRSKDNYSQLSHPYYIKRWM